MLTAYEKRPVVPHPVKARRASSGLPVRIAYGAGLIAVGLYLAWHFGRSMLFLEGTGTVSAPLYVVSTPHLSQISYVNVTPGIMVADGDLLATLESTQLDQEINSLERILVEQSHREADLRIRLRIAMATMDLARDRLAIAEEAFSRIDASNTAVTRAAPDLNESFGVPKSVWK